VFGSFLDNSLGDACEMDIDGDDTLDMTDLDGDKVMDSKDICPENKMLYRSDFSRVDIIRLQNGYREPKWASLHNVSIQTCLLLLSMFSSPRHGYCHL